MLPLDVSADHLNKQTVLIKVILQLWKQLFYALF